MTDIVKELRDALSELVNLMQGVIDGDYKPDSCTLQPARAVLLATAQPEAARPLKWSNSKREDCPKCSDPAACEAAGKCRDWLEVVPADQQPTAQPAAAPPLNVDGIVLSDGRVMLVGQATWNGDTGKYRCLADVEGALCMVEIKVTPR